MKDHLKDKSEADLLKELEIMLPKLRDPSHSWRVHCDGKDGKLYEAPGRPLPAWQDFADYVEALIEIKKPKKRGANKKKYPPFSCATAYRYLMKRYDKESLQFALDDLDGKKGKSECAQEIVCELACIAVTTLEEQCKRNAQGSKNLSSALIDVASELKLPDDPRMAAKQIMSIADTGGIKFTQENQNL